MELREGTIIKGIGGAYTVMTGTPPLFFVCNARGVFRNKKITPLVGDRVKILPAEKQTGTIYEILPRKNELRRPPAANIEQVIVTVSVSQPAFNAGFTDRLLIMIEREEIPIIICVNKIDLETDRETFDIYRQAGYEIVYTDAKGDTGLDSLREKMAGKINLFAGASGVGKSSLINALLPNSTLETGEVSAKIGRGKHTTRHTEMFPLDDAGGFCFDTPGFTSLEFDMQKNELAPLFREFRPFLGLCKFKNCLHVKEIGCAVKEQVGSKIHPARYESYVKLL
ncbi:MAG: ribosome small subunit-dependent GTPase A [Defluviitaleaceae bacterium]|nr:ribosome small subunit-dependent GTPase A [Defluviitaleaceae bacterium]